MITFEYEYQIKEYLEKNRFKMLEAKDEELAKYILPVIASPLLDDHKFMMEVDKWFALKLFKKLSKVMREYFYLMGDIDISLYKFAIITLYRGPLTVEEFDSFILSRYMNDVIQQNVAKHKDFPLHLKQKFYEIEGDVEYLPKDAQDIFIF